MHEYTAPLSASAKKKTPEAARTKKQKSDPVKKERAVSCVCVCVCVCALAPSECSLLQSEAQGTPTKKAKKEEEKEVWKWWEEKPHADGVKWLTLEHKGPCFAPPYERLPEDVKFYYDGDYFLSSLVHDSLVFLLLLSPPT